LIAAAGAVAVTGVSGSIALAAAQALADEDGLFRLEMPQTVPVFGKAHGHLEYDRPEFETVFLRPLLPDPSDAALNVDFGLQPV
jgi:hypothetical protein